MGAILIMDPVPVPASALRVKRITFSDIEAEISRKLSAQPSGGTLAPLPVPVPFPVPIPVPIPAHTPMSSSDNDCSSGRPSINHCINSRRYKPGQVPEPEPEPVSMTSHTNEKSSNLNTTGWIPRNEFQRETFKNLQFDVKNFLTISNKGISTHEAYCKISDTIGEELRYKDCGFERFEEFLYHCQEFLDVRTDGSGGYYLFLQGKSTQETEHVRELILQQKKNWVGFQATTQNTRIVPPGILLDSKIWKNYKSENENLPHKIIPQTTTSCDANSGVKNNFTVINNSNTDPVPERSSTKGANYFKGGNNCYPRSCNKNNNNRNYNFHITDRFDRMFLNNGSSTIANKTEIKPEAAAIVSNKLNGGGDGNGIRQHHKFHQNLKSPWQQLKMGEKPFSSTLLGVDGFGFFIIQTNDSKINDGFDNLQALLGQLYTTSEERDKYRMKPSDLTEGILVGVFKGLAETEKNYFALARIFEVNLEKNECTVITLESHNFLVVPVNNIYKIQKNITNFSPKVIMCSLDGLDEYMMTATAEIRKAFEKIPLPRSREVTVTVTAEHGKFYVPSVTMSIKNDNIDSGTCSNEKNYDALQLIKQYGSQNGCFQILKSEGDIQSRQEFQKHLFYYLRSKNYFPE